MLRPHHLPLRQPLPLLLCLLFSPATCGAEEEVLRAATATSTDTEIEAPSDESCPAGNPACGLESIAGEEGPPRRQYYYWPQQKGDVNRTGLSPHTATFNISGGPTWVWRDPDLNLNRHTPLIDDQRNIYLATVSGRLYKFSPEGQLLWQHNTHSKLPAVPAIMDGKLFYNRQDGFVVAFGMERPRVLWESQISNHTGGDTACLYAVDGLVVSATQLGQIEVAGMGENNAVVALHGRNGSHAWTFRHKWPSYNFQASGPGDGTMIFQDRAGGVYRLDLADGSLIWESGVPEGLRAEADFSTGAAVVGPNGLVYATSNFRDEGVVHAYRLADGERVWWTQIGMQVNQAVAVGVLAGSERLSVVTGVGTNPQFPASLFFLHYMIQFNILLSCLCCCRCCICKCKRGSSRCCRYCLLLLLLFLLEGPLVLAYHQLTLALQMKPGWLFFVKELPAAMVALDAETGQHRWVYTPPRFEKSACEGDTENFLPMLYKTHVLGEPGDPICLPDNWAQTVIDAAGTTYGGHQDGYLYTVRDSDGSGTIEPEKEVSRFYLGAAFQASQAIGPGLLAAVPCSGGLFVWES